jgi:hypothetical protein
MRQITPDEYAELYAEEDGAAEEYVADRFRWMASPELIEGYVENYLAQYDAEANSGQHKTRAKTAKGIAAARVSANMRRTQLEGMLRNQASFLAAYAETGNIKLACGAAGVARSRYYEWNTDTTPVGERFRRLIVVAKEQATETLEAEARRRAVHGTRKVRTFYDKEGGVRGKEVEIQYSDTLLIFLLKGVAPEKYRERVDISGSLDHKLAAQAEELANELGVNAAELLADAERILKEITAKGR